MKVASPKLCGECTSRSQMRITEQARYLPPRFQNHLPSFLLPSECYSFPATPKWENIKEVNLPFVSMLHSLSFFFETWQAHACEVSESHSVVSSPWNSPGQNTRVSSLSLLQGIFPTQGSNPGLPHCRLILDQLSYQGSPWPKLDASKHGLSVIVAVVSYRPFHQR